MRLALACAATAALIAFAGCTSPPEDAASSSSTSSTSSTPSVPTASSYTITVTAFPTSPVARNSTFTFMDHIAGDATRMSDHIGAHYGPAPQVAPSTTLYPAACVHVSGNLPGDYQVTCPAPGTAGTYYLRGHARITTGTNATVSWWSDELTFTVV